VLRLRFITAVTMRITVLFGETHLVLIYMGQCFGVSCYVLLQGRR
jgi:hypothetical protein